MNPAMWLKALRVVPRIDKAEWERLDLVSRWLIATRAVVLVMTFLSAAIAGILALHHGRFDIGRWLLLALGLVFAHATNNLINDLTDYTKGVDQENYYRAQYGPQPLVHGLLTRSQLMVYIILTGLVALLAGGILVYLQGGYTLLLLGLGVFFVLFYTFPLKYIALGELAVLIVWGPLMVGGGYYVITGIWDWQVVIASLPYALGVTTVIFGKHIDKLDMDHSRRIFTLPVLIGERPARYAVVAMFALQYLSVFYLVATGFFSLLLLIVLLALPSLNQVLPLFRQPKPDEKPADFPDVWPNYFVAGAFVHNRRFGMLYLLGLILEAVLIAVRPLL